MKNLQNNFWSIIKKNIWLIIIQIIATLILTQALIKGVDIISKSVDLIVDSKTLDWKTIVPKLFIYTILAVISAFAKIYFGKFAGIKILKDFREIIIKKLVRLEYKYFDDNGSGKVVSRLISDVKEVQRFFSEILIEIITTIITVVTIFWYIFKVNKWLILAIIISYPFIFLSVKVISKKVTQLARKRRKLIDEETATVYDIIGGMAIARSYNLYDVMMKRISDILDNIFGVEVTRAKITSYIESFRMLLEWIPSVICLTIGALMVQRGDITIGNLMAFILLTQRAFEPLSSLPYYINLSVDAIISIERLEEMLQVKEENSNGIEDIEVKNTAVEFQNVSFSYDDYGENEILKNVSFKFQVGKKYAFVGHSGSGKSTIFKLIAGFYKPKNGVYKLFDKDFETLNIEKAREKIAIISQDIFLFPVSIKDNIAYGKENATDNEIISACKKANIHDFIQTLPNGYDTFVGERGVKLSGGERQRISIARALLKNADLLLLDEPTSALDNENERLLKETIEKFGNKKTIITIAHRISTIEDYDQIFVIENGQIIESGTSKELLNKNGSYASFYKKFDGGIGNEFN